MTVLIMTGWTAVVHLPLLCPFVGRAGRKMTSDNSDQDQSDADSTDGECVWVVGGWVAVGGCGMHLVIIGLCFIKSEDITAMSSTIMRWGRNVGCAH